MSLVVVAGPSYVGKSSVLRAMRQELCDDTAIVFPARVVTKDSHNRTPGLDESLTLASFQSQHPAAASADSSSAASSSSSSTTPSQFLFAWQHAADGSWMGYRRAPLLRALARGCTVVVQLPPSQALVAASLLGRAAAAADAAAFEALADEQEPGDLANNVIIAANDVNLVLMVVSTPSETLLERVRKMSSGSKGDDVKSNIARVDEDVRTFTRDITALSGAVYPCPSPQQQQQQQQQQRVDAEWRVVYVQNNDEDDLDGMAAKMKTAVASLKAAGSKECGSGDENGVSGIVSSPTAREHDATVDLKTCSPQQYLQHTVYALVQQGLSVLERERPSDPVLALATYLTRLSTTETREAEAAAKAAAAAAAAREQEATNFACGRV